MRGSSRSSKTVKKNSVSKKSSGNNDASVEGVFRIVIQRSLKEMVDLPEIKVWSMLPRTIQARMVVRIRRYGFFFAHDSEEVPMRCVLTRRNYLIIYAKEKQLKGYAVKLSLAEKLNIVCNRTEKGRCNVTIKWRFGEISLTMLKEHIADWRSRILDAFEGISSVATPEKSCDVGVQTDDLRDFKANNKGVKRVKTFSSYSTDGGIKNADNNAKDESAPMEDHSIANEEGKNESVESEKFEDAKLYLREVTLLRPVANPRFDSGEKVSDVKTPPSSPTKVGPVMIPRFGSGEKISDAKTPPSSPSKVGPVMIPRFGSVRRSISSPALDFSKLKKDSTITITSPPFVGPRKLLVPKRSVGRIERPLAAPPAQSSDLNAWCTVVGRYGFENENDRDSTTPCIRLTRRLFESDA